MWFLIFDLLREVITHYGVSISQIYPIGICRLIAFEMTCRQVGVNSLLALFRQFYQMKGMDRMFYFLSRPKGRDFLGASAELAGGWRMRYLIVRATNFLAGMGWRQLRGGNRRPMTGYSVQEVRKLELVEPFDLTVTMSASLEREGLWKKGSVSAVVGEAEGSLLL